MKKFSLTPKKFPVIVYQNILGLELRNKKPREVFRAQKFSLARCMCGELSQLRNLEIFIKCFSMQINNLELLTIWERDFHKHQMSLYLIILICRNLRTYLISKSLKVNFLNIVKRQLEKSQWMQACKKKTFFEKKKNLKFWVSKIYFWL